MVINDLLNGMILQVAGECFERLVVCWCFFRRIVEETHKDISG